MTTVKPVAYLPQEPFPDRPIMGGFVHQGVVHVIIGFGTAWTSVPIEAAGADRLYHDGLNAKAVKAFEAAGEGETFSIGRRKAVKMSSADLLTQLQEHFPGARPGVAAAPDPLEGLSPLVRLVVYAKGEATEDSTRELYGCFEDLKGQGYGLVIVDGKLRAALINDLDGDLSAFKRLSSKDTKTFLAGQNGDTLMLLERKALKRDGERLIQHLRGADFDFDDLRDLQEDQEPI